MTAVTVFASSSPDTPPAFLRTASELGRGIAARRWLLINGAGNSGGMGALNDACLAAGGRVEGVILRRFHAEGLGHAGLHHLVIAEDMRERKRLLGERADAFIALPGGPGTFEEFWELAVERQLRLHAKPLVLVNLAGYYDGFLAQTARAAAEGLLYGPPDELFTVTEDAPGALAVLAEAWGG
jgi:hypothetical protein